MRGNGPCGGGTTLLWLAVFWAGLALISSSILALPGTLLRVFAGLLLIGVGTEMLVAGVGCPQAILGYAFLP